MSRRCYHSWQIMPPILFFALLMIQPGCAIDLEWLEDQFSAKEDDDPKNKVEAGQERELADDYVESTEPLAADEFKLLVVGDSLSAAYEDVSHGELYHRIAQPWLSDCGYNIRMANISQPGIKSARGIVKLTEYLQEATVPPTHVLIALGSNDGLQLEPIATLKSNLSQLIEHIQSGGAKPLLAGNKLPDNFAERAIAGYQGGKDLAIAVVNALWGIDIDRNKDLRDQLDNYADEANEYALDFEKVFADLAGQYKIPLWSNILHKVGGVPGRNQNDGIHPNAEGHRYMATHFVHFIQNKTDIRATSQATDACQFTALNP